MSLDFLFPAASSGPWTGPLSLAERGDAGQHLALEELEGGAAASGDVAHLGSEPGLVHGRDGVAAAHNGGGAAGGGGSELLGDRKGSLSEVLELEHPHRTVP